MELKSGVGYPQGSIDFDGSPRSREDKAQITGAFGQREHRLTRLCRDDDVLDANHRARRFETVDARVNAGGGNRNHHDSMRAAIQANLRDVFAGRMPQQDFFKRRAALEPQHAGTQPSNGPRGDFEHPYARVIDPHLGMNGTVGHTECRGGARGGIEDGLLCCGRFARRREVNGFLKKRSIERVGLVEQRQRLKTPAREQAFQSEFASGYEAFDQHRLVSGDVPDTREGCFVFATVVRADHAAAGGKRSRLEDTRVRWLSSRTDQFEVWNQQTGIAEFLAHEEFVFRGGDRFGRTESQTKPLGCLRGQERRLISDTDDAVKGSAAFERTRAVGDGNRVIAQGLSRT